MPDSNVSPPANAIFDSDRAAAKLQRLRTGECNGDQDRHRTENRKSRPERAIRRTVNCAIGENLIRQLFALHSHPSAVVARFEGEMKKLTGSKGNGHHLLDSTIAAMERMERYCASNPGSPSAARRPRLQFRGQLWVALLGRASRKESSESGRPWKPRSARSTLNTRRFASAEPIASPWTLQFQIHGR